MAKDMTEHELTLLIQQLNLDGYDKNLTGESMNDNKSNVKTSGTSPEQDGWIQVKDQTIHVSDPVNGGKMPVISSIAPVKLIINDVEFISESSVSSTDHIQWRIIENPLFEIKVSEDKLYAYFQLISKERYAWRLIEIEPIQKIIIMAEQDKDTVLETLHLSDVVTYLEQKLIKLNLGIASIQLEIIDPTYKPIMIAKGKASIPGEDAILEVYFSEQVESQFFEVSGSVDFRNHLNIPSVKSGEVIAKRIPPVDGIPGFDVYGNVIIPTPPKDTIIVMKSNVELTPDGEIIARKEGRPRITGGRIKTFDISTSYIVSGDVDIEIGNIVFSGDVIVYGNVTDNMIVESLGNVYVYGSVYNATITATGSIHVRGNVIGSKLYSGYFGVMFNRLYHTSKLLSEKIEQLISAAQVLAQVLEQKKQTIRYGQIILLLIENKFKDIPAKINDLVSLISNIQHLKKEEYQKLKERSEIFSQRFLLLEKASLSFMQGFLALLRGTFEEVARMQEDKVQTIINQCHKSELKSNGDITILREGVLLSDLFSAGNITFNHELAVCRGSKLEAEGSIIAKIIGGETGANTTLKANRQVTVKKMYAGRVCVGRFCMDIFDLIEDKTFDVFSIKRRA
jgi:uncharacterized protein (DUF342 family)